jgi:hypothetical protein
MSQQLEDFVRRGQSATQAGYHFESSNSFGQTPTFSRRMSIMSIDYNAFNAELRAWGKSTASKVKVSAGRFGGGDGSLRKSIRAKFGRSGVEINRIGFNLARHGVFLQKGVGRGYQFQNGGVHRIAKSEMPHKPRFPVNWFNGAVDSELNQLQQIVTHHAGDAIETNVRSILIL